MTFAPLVAVERAGLIESIHSGIVAVADGRGRITASIGDPGHVTFPRSSLKFIQALPLCETGAYDAFKLTPRHLALACASHDAQPLHTGMVAEWLELLGMDENALKCGPDYPADRPSREEMIRKSSPPARICHNCSGKHSGFLTVCRHMGWDAGRYNEALSPANAAFTENLALLAGNMPESGFTTGIDGCTLPAPALSIGDMARAMGRFASPAGLPAKKQQAAEAVAEAAYQHPEMVSATDSGEVKTIRAARKKFAIKVGAEGYFVGAVPEKGLGFALKIADGSVRAALPAAVRTLYLIGALSDDEYESLAPVHSPDITNSVKDVVGRIRPVFHFD